MTPTSILFGYAVLGACLVLPSIASSFVMADVMGMTPSEMTAVAVWCSLPWVTKPLWGAVSDRCSVCGYRRRPYVCVFSLVATASLAATPYYATAKTRDMMIFMLFCTSASLCIMDVALDGSLMVLVKGEKKGTKNEGKSQTHSWMARVAGGCLGSGWSGIVYEWGGIKWVCYICGGMCLVLSVVALDIPDETARSPAQGSLSCASLAGALWTFIRRSKFVLLAAVLVGIVPEIGTAQFFYLLSADATPVSLSYIDLAGSSASFLSLCLYSLLKPSHRLSFFLGVFLNGMACALGALLTSDSVPWIVPMACAEAIISSVGGTLCLMPVITLLGHAASRSRYESTLYSAGLSVLNGASVVSESVAGLAMRRLHIASGDTDNIRRFVGVVAAMTFLLTPVALLFPRTTPEKKDDSGGDHELVPLKAPSEASFSLECSESSEDEEEVVFDMKRDVLNAPLPSV